MTETLIKQRYRIERSLSSGGFSDTFLAEDTQMPSQRRCVVKRLRPTSSSSETFQLVRDRFSREAAILEDLGAQSDRIPQLYGFFEEDGWFYLVQEWVAGATLTEKVQSQGRLGEGAIRDVLTDLLNVLAYVHDKGIVHRDIKPDNIILRDRDGKPVLLDFGSVRETMGLSHNTAGATAQSVVIGTPGFMAAEQSAGRAVFSSDLYSLGVTAIYALTGKLPHMLDTDPLTGSLLWRSEALNVSPTLSTVLNRAIQLSPRDRFPTARDMLAALQSHSAMPATELSVAPPSGAFPVTPNAGEAIVPTTSPQAAIASATAAPPPASNFNWKLALFFGWLLGASVVGGIFAFQYFEIDLRPRQADRESPAAPTAELPPETTALASVESSSNATSSEIAAAPSTLLTQEGATQVVRNWLGGKQRMFAPPYDRQLAAQLTADEQYREVAGPDGSIQWLRNNNAYYSYRLQSIDNVENFAVQGDRASIAVQITEDSSLFVDGRRDTSREEYTTMRVRYALQREGSNWKIANTEILK